MTIPAASALYTSESQTWNTPASVLERVRMIAPIALDPCSNEDSIVGAAEEWRIERGEDGLARTWDQFGLNYCNPPYEDLLSWGRKLAREAARGCEIIALIPARPDTVAFQDHILATCTAVCFWRGRMKYGAGRARTAQISLLSAIDAPLEEGENCAPFPSCVPYWGTRPRRFVRAFESAGWVVVCR